MKIIEVDLIPHSQQRYDTVGDWIFHDDQKLTINISNLHDQAGISENDYTYKHSMGKTSIADSHVLVAVHEIIEAVLCRARGITDEVVTAWDKQHEDHPDPGSIPGCPYYAEHMYATMIEKSLASELDMSWDEHGRNIESLYGDI